MIDEDDAFLDINKVSFDDYLNQVKLILKKDKNDQTQFMKSVIRLGLSSIIDYLPSLKMECLPGLTKNRCVRSTDIMKLETIYVK